ncbi:MAG: hypothetical protein KBE65_07050 [Phycisphaerae bacterium]|nr:hypothetical protein [Phycisphaerae bacterium]
MVGAKTTEAVRRLAESFSAVSSASEAVFLYYKFGRHDGVFSEKPYFLLSHCAHVLFTLWRFEEEERGTMFQDWPGATAFLTGLDFDALRYQDYKRRVLHADSIEDHWRNETQWFEFWIQVLEHWDPSGTASYQEFSQQILAWASQSEVLEKAPAHKNPAGSNQFLRTDAAGSVMLRTLSILDEVMRGLVQCLAGLDPKIWVVERITVLTALLNEMRRTVVCQTPARGPYTPLGATRWRAPSPLGRLFWGRTQGILTVVPKREGGNIVCAYDPPSQPRSRRRSWMRPASSLAGTYEQELFATWSYETGDCRDDPGHSTDAKAHWTLQNQEAERLETVTRRIDALLDGWSLVWPYERLVEEVRTISRNGQTRWKAMDLLWTYVHDLDQLVGKLRFICREAKVAGGDDAVERAIAAVWALPVPTTDRTDSPSTRDCPDCAADQLPPGARQPVAETGQTPEAARCDASEEKSTSTATPTPLAETREEVTAPPVPASSSQPQPAEAKPAPHRPVPTARVKRQPRKRTSSPKKPQTNANMAAVALAKEIWRQQAARQAAAQGPARETCSQNSASVAATAPQQPPTVRE